MGHSSEMGRRRTCGRVQRGTECDTEASVEEGIVVVVAIAPWVERGRREARTSGLDGAEEPECGEDDEDCEGTDRAGEAEREDAVGDALREAAALEFVDRWREEIAAVEMRASERPASMRGVAGVWRR